MRARFLISMILVVGLTGCNLPGASDRIIPDTATEEAQIDAPPPGETSAGPDVIEVVPVPATGIEIEGVAYTAYQFPGDPFRFVCQEPCPHDPQYIYAEYAGFRLAHAKLIELTGVDTLAELQPVDMHLGFEDSICSPRPWGHAYIYSSVHRAYTCTDGPGYYPTLEEKVRMAARIDGQYFPLHEYMHTIFFGRLSGQAGNFQDYRAEFMHDFVVWLPSFAIGPLDPDGFCSYRDPLAPGDFGGWLITELCTQNGFELTDLALSLIELDRIYQTGAGQVDVEGYLQPVPSVAQYRDILNRILGGDTTNAFAAACWPPELFGSSFSPPPACQSAAPSGTATPVR